MITRSAVVGDESREACFSEDLTYRYRLDITWAPGLPTLTTIALNPSKADEWIDDNTIRRGKDFAKQFGCGTYRMLNAFALRSTDHTALFRSKDPIGPENTVDYLRYWSEGTMTIACWGTHITERNWRHHERGRDISDGVPNLQCLALTQRGHPQHPLYLPKTFRPFPFKYE